MGLYLKITAGFLLIVHAFHLASLQASTHSPGRTFPKNWLRGVKNTAGNLNSTVTEEVTEYDQEADATALDHDYSGIASGSMAVFNKEEGNLLDHEKSENNIDDDLNVVTTTLPPTFLNGTTRKPELPDTTVSQNTTTIDATNSGQINMTKAKEGSYNSTTTPQTSTTHLISQNYTNLPDFSNRTDLEATATLGPESNATQESTTKPEKDTGSTNSTSSTNTTTATNTTTPGMNKTSTTYSSTTVIPAETTETNPKTSTAAASNTPVMANKTDKDGASGSSSERGLASDSHHSKRNGAWGAVLGTAVAVVIVGLVAYIILKKKQQKGFSHRKLVEEYPSDPVLRLDNSEPLDLNFGGSAYYNPGLQGDNIQMTNFPGHHRN